MEMKKRRAAILIFNDVELLDFAGPFEVLSAVRIPPDRREQIIDVFAVAESMDSVTCRNGLVVQPAYSLEDCPPVEILVIPGGQGTRAAIRRPELIDWIAGRSQEAELTTSVCTGSFLLAQAGLLDGKAATTHWGSIQRLRDDFPTVTVKENTRWVEAGNVISSAGVSAGIDMALHIVGKLYGEENADETARWIEYDHWQS
jgi:transcriptional regulator GlxA family with amidase domain